jgi:ABC-type uncharacterized transport system substrate-binding protein
MRLLGLLLALCSALPAFAQERAELPLVGVLRITSAANTEPTATLLRDELAAFGDVDGKNIRLDFRLADGEAIRFPELAEALVREKASVIVVQGPAAARAAQHATRSIPIVAAGNDLVALGLIDSMARPGHNITGVTLLIPRARCEAARSLAGDPAGGATLRPPERSLDQRSRGVAGDHR